MTDTHCHLYDAPMGTDPGAVLSRARAVGVGTVVVPGTDAATSAEALRLAREHVGVLAAVGVHPEVVDAEGFELAAVEGLLRGGGAVAVGEVGLDHAGRGHDQETQRRAFKAQAVLARDLGLPLLVHCRLAFAPVVEVLEDLGPDGPGGILHAFNGSVEVAGRLALLGFRFGVGGVATRSEATRVRALVAALPLDLLCLETDAPYIGTALHPKGGVEPAHLPEVLAAVAALKGEPEDAVERATDECAASVLRLSL